MARIGDYVDAVEPVSPDTPGSVVFDRFQAEPNTLAIAVVDADGRPLGLIERNAFTLKMAAEFGRALYARRPVSGLMDANPPTAEAGGVAGLLQRKLEQPELKPYVETILDSGQTLLRLLTDALDMSRASAGILTLDAGPMNVGALGEDLAALWRPRAEEKGLALTVACDPAGGDWVMADAMRVKQLLNNLIGNALKFTQAGEVAVSLTTRREGDAVRLEAVIDDSGPGVPEAAAATIFEPFNTGQAGREGAGAGLGLAICRQIVDRIGGSIGLDRSPQGGARFRFDLVLEACDAADRGETQAEPTPHETLHVLVADDNATNRFVATRLLEMFGCTHETAENGAQAVEAASVRAFDLILMDIKMPVMDGVAATRAIRALKGPAGRTPILALTANADPRDEADYVAAGMNGVAQKPIQPDALLNAIRLTLGAEQVAEAEAA